MKSTIKKLKVIPAFILVFVCVFTSFVFAYDDSLFSKTEINDTITVSARISTFGMEDKEYKCEYSDSFFSLPDNQYNHQFSRLSMGLASAAGRDKLRKATQDDNLIDFYNQMGFTNIETDTFKEEPTANSIAYGIATKEIDGCTIISVGVCGHNYTKEWSGNLTVGDGERHEGFNTAALQVEEGVKKYIEKYNITGKKKIWISGFSRAGATSNIAAADFTDSGEYEAVYAYCFAAPRTTMDEGDYKNIFNILGKDDVVPKVPLADWGYKRYGIDLYIKSQEADSDSIYGRIAMAEAYYNITGKQVYTNPELTFQFRTIFDFLVMLMPTATDYKERLQSEILEIMDGATADNAIQIAIQALSKLVPESAEEQQDILELIDYLQLLLNKYVLQGNEEQIKNGYWDPKLGTGFNLFTEHNPFKYMAWLDSTDDPKELFSENTEYTRLSLSGRNLKVEIYDKNGFVGKINEQGQIVAEDGTEDLLEERTLNGEINPEPVAQYSSEKVVVSLPGDNEWMVLVSSDTSEDITYTAIIYSNDTARAISGKIYRLKMTAGEVYQISIAEGAGGIDEENSDFNDSSETLTDRYSPATIMRLETVNVFHLTIQELVGVFILVLLIIMLEILVSVVLAIIRVIRKKKRHTGSTVVFHVINLVLFVLLETGAWALMPAFPGVQLAIKVIIGLIILGLGVKGYKRYKEKYKIYVCELSMLMIVIDMLIEGFILGIGSTIKWPVALTCYVLAVVIACFAWKKPKIMVIEADDIKDTREGRKARREAKKLERQDKRELTGELKEIGKELQDQFDDDENI